MPRYRVKFEERAAYEVEFHADSPSIDTETWFGAMDRDSSDWFNNAQVLDRVLWSLEVECPCCHQWSEPPLASRICSDCTARACKVCALCGDFVRESGQRGHLREHGPAADAAMESGDVSSFYEDP